MKKSIRIRSVGLSLVLALIVPDITTNAQVTEIEIRDNILRENVKRFGINIGSRSRWGAAQFLKNLIDNPGFEAGEFGTVALAESGGDERTFRQKFWETAWNNDASGVGQPVGFWDNAEYEIVWGAAAGRSGRVGLFLHENNRYAFRFSDVGTAPAEWDVMFVRTQAPGIGGNIGIADPNVARPGSPGSQSLRLSGSASRFDFYMDSFWRDGDTSAGKLLVVKGNWHVEFWARGAAGDIARVRFFRETETDFFNEQITLTSDWRKYEFDFFVPDGADPVRAYDSEEYRPILGFRIEIEPPGATTWIDDVAVYSTDHTNPTVFTDSYVDKLKELQPGIVRDWSNQLGATLDNQLAEPWARKTHGYKPGTRRATQYAYSLHEFLELAQEVGAEPWYVVPPTFSPADLRHLIEYLAAPTQDDAPYAQRRAALGRERPWTEEFATIHLEFGNELWGGANANDPFQGASVNGGVRLGAIASDRFGIMRAAPHYDDEKFHLIIGGQAGFAGRQGEIERSAEHHDAIALAPYFGILDQWASDEEVYQPLFAAPFFETSSGGRMRQSREQIDAENTSTPLAIYEINFHTTGGVAPIDIRNDFLSGVGGALALPLTMLVYQRDLNVIDQCAFSSLQYAFRLGNGDYAKLWGMLRDIEATGRKRPTFLGLELANKAILPNILETVHSGLNPQWTQMPINGIGAETTVEYVQSFAFGAGVQRSIILFNLHLHESAPIELQLPYLPEAHAIRYDIYANDIHTNNERGEQIAIARSEIEDFASTYQTTLPPHSITALVWDQDIGVGVAEDVYKDGRTAQVWFQNPARELPPIHYFMPEQGQVQCEIFDLAGRSLYVWVENIQDPDARAWRTFSTAGSATQPEAGMYIVRMTAPSGTIARMLIITP